MALLLVHHTQQRHDGHKTRRNRTNTVAKTREPVFHNLTIIDIDGALSIFTVRLQFNMRYWDFGKIGFGSGAMPVLVKRTLRKYGNLPDIQDAAVQIVL